MVGLAVALRLRLLRGSLRSGPGSATRQFGLVVGAVFGAGLALLGFALLASLRGSQRDDVAVLLFSALLVGWVVLPVLTFAGDDLMDPSRLALLPLSRRELATVLGVGAAVGVAPVATLLACLGLVVGAGGVAATGVALLAVLLQVGLCLSVGRLVAALLSGLLRSRRGRDLGVALTALVGVSFQLVNPVLQRVTGPDARDGDLLARLAAPLADLPPGLLAGAPGLARDGRTGTALLRLLLVAGLVAVAAWAWQAAIARAMLAVDRTTGGGRRRRGPVSALLDRLPGRAGAIAAKDLRYTRREPRRLVGFVTLVLLPFVIALGPAFAGDGFGTETVFVVCGVALLASSLGSNRFGADGTATWLLVAAQGDRRSARRDLAGGDLATTLLLVPVVVTLAVGFALVTGGQRFVPAALGLSFALLGVGTGLSCLASVYAPFAVPENPTSALSGGGAGAGARTLVVALVQLLGVPLLCLPLLVLLLPALDSVAAGWALLVVGPAYGLALGAVAREVAARAWSRRGPEVLQVLSSGRN